jgi:hypothetical protein
MSSIAWVGPPPPRALAERLRAREIHIDREEREGLPLVVSTATAAKLPSPRAERGRWIWLSGEVVPSPRAWMRCCAGHDVIALTRPMRSIRSSRGSRNCSP